ncbi:MAG: nucleotide kinase domain-containing protein [Alphaproteobacteria bacterium]
MKYKSTNASQKSTSADSLQLDVDFSNKVSSPASEAITIAGQKVLTTPVFYAYWRFAAERQNIFFRRLDRTNTALTNDPILKSFKFTNTYRASDRVSQFLIRDVIYRDDLPDSRNDLFFRILLFKLFNKIETWKLLEAEFGKLTWETFNYDLFDKVLSRHMAKGERIYSAAYIMPSAGNVFGHPLKHQNHLRMLEQLIKDGFSIRLSECRSMSDAFKLLLSAPSIGPFLAYQFATDLNYSTLTNFSEDDFVMAGPGALDGISKCFQSDAKLDPADVIRYMRDNQEYHFSNLEINFKSLWGRALKLIDCQNIFCEISKYARVAFPEYGGIAGRTRIKQKYTSAGSLLAPWYPPKWKINRRIADSFS